MKKFECKKHDCPYKRCYVELDDNRIARCLSGWTDNPQWNELLEKSEQLPKLTVEALAERGIEWPEWAKYAAVDSDRYAHFFRGNKRPYFSVELIPGQWDNSDWQNSLIKRPEVVKQNLTTELPEWCKFGAWVYSAALRTEFARITGPGKTSETLSAVTAEGFKCIVLVDKQAISCGATKPARVRPWTFGEAPESVKTAENSEYLECCWHLNGICKGEPSFFCWKDNFISASKMAETMTQLDGSPCGVLEVVE